MLEDSADSQNLSSCSAFEHGAFTRNARGNSNSTLAHTLPTTMMLRRPLGNILMRHRQYLKVHGSSAIFPRLMGQGDCERKIVGINADNQLQTFACFLQSTRLSMLFLRGRDRERNTQRWYACYMSQVRGHWEWKMFFNLCFTSTERWSIVCHALSPTALASLFSST